MRVICRWFIITPLKTTLLILFSTCIVSLILGYFLNQLAVEAEVAELVFELVVLVSQCTLIVHLWAISKFKSSPTGIYRFYWIAEQLILLYQARGYSIESLKTAIERRIEDHKYTYGAFIVFFAQLFLLLKIGDLLFKNYISFFVHAGNIYFQGELDLLGGPLLYTTTFIIFGAFALSKGYYPKIWLSEVRAYVDFIENTKSGSDFQEENCGAREGK